MITKGINIFFLFSFFSNFIVYNTYPNSLCYLEFNLKADSIAYAVDPSNEKIAIAFTDGTVRIFDLMSGKCALTLKVGKFYNYNLGVATLLERLGNISEDQKKEIYAAHSWSLIYELFWHKDGQSIFVSIEKSNPNKKNLESNHFWEQWDIKTGKILKTCSEAEANDYTSWTGHQVNVAQDRSFVFNNSLRESQSIAIYRAKHDAPIILPFYTTPYQGKNWGTIFIYDAIKTIPLSEPANAVYWDTDGKNLIVVKQNGIFLLDIETELISPFFLLAEEECTSTYGDLCFSPKGKNIAVQVYNKNGSWSDIGACIDILDANNARHIKRINNAYMLCFNLNGTKVIFFEKTTGKVGIYNLF